MPPWNEVLNRIVGRKGSIPRHAQTLRLPLIDGWEEGRVWSSWSVDADVIQPQGNVFGGYLSAVADEMVGMATLTVLDDTESFVTSNCHIDYFRPVQAEELNVEARVIHKGGSSVVVEATFKNAAGKLVARASATQILKRPE